MRRLAYGLVLAAALVCGGAGAAPQTEAPYDWSNPLIAQRDCSAATAAEIPFARFAGDPGAFIGRCLHLTGIVVRRTLFDGIDGYYRRGPYEGGRAREDAERSHIGLFTGDPLYDLLYKGGAFDADVIGLARACWQLYRPDVTIVGGYCHHENGAILVVASARVTPTHLTRLTGDAARERVGDLRAAPPDWPERAMATALANRWLADIETGNIADFRTISGRPPSDDMVSLAFTATPSPFERFRGNRVQPQAALFVPRDPERAGNAQYGTVGVSCFCRIDDCTGRWPISTLDTDNTVQRPYVCTTIDRDNGVPLTYTEAGDARIEEPAAP